MARRVSCCCCAPAVVTAILFTISFLTSAALVAAGALIINKYHKALHYESTAICAYNVNSGHYDTVAAGSVYNETDYEGLGLVTGQCSSHLLNFEKKYVVGCGAGSMVSGILGLLIIIGVIPCYVCCLKSSRDSEDQRFVTYGIAIAVVFGVALLCMFIQAVSCNNIAWNIEKLPPQTGLATRCHVPASNTSGSSQPSVPALKVVTFSAATDTNAAADCSVLCERTAECQAYNINGQVCVLYPSNAVAQESIGGSTSDCSGSNLGMPPNASMAHFVIGKSTMELLPLQFDEYVSIEAYPLIKGIHTGLWMLFLCGFVNFGMYCFLTAFIYLGSLCWAPMVACVEHVAERQRERKRVREEQRQQRQAPDIRTQLEEAVIAHHSGVFSPLAVQTPTPATTPTPQYYAQYGYELAVVGIVPADNEPVVGTVMQMQQS